MLYNGRIYPTVNEVLRMIDRASKAEITARDPRKLLGLCMQIRKMNPTIQGHISVRKTALSAFEYTIESGVDNADETAANAARLRLENLIDVLIRRHTQTPLFGASVAALRVVYTEGLGNVIEMEKWYAPTEIEKFGDEVYILLEDRGTMERKRPSDLHTLFLVDQNEDFDSGGILATIAVFEVLRNEALRDWNNFNQKLKGLIHAAYDPERMVRDETNHPGKSDIDVAHEALDAVIQNGTVATSNAVEIALRELTTSGGYLSFDRFITAMNEAAAIAILGQANTSSLPSNGGSRAALQVLNQIRKDIHYDDMQRVERWLNALLLLDYRQNTDANAVRVPYRFRFNIEEEQDHEANARTFEIMHTAGAIMDEAEVSRKVGFTVRLNTDGVL